MSLIARGRPLLCNGSITKHIYSPAIASSSHKSATRQFAQTATPEHECAAEETDQRRLPADHGPASFNSTEHRSPPSGRTQRLVDEMDGLTLVEAAELSVILVGRIKMRSRWCCRSPAMWVMKPGAGGVARPAAIAGAAAKEGKRPEKTAFEQDGIH